MWSLRNIPIRRKLMLVITLTSAVALLLACTGFIAYQMAIFWDRVTHDLSILADVLAANSSAALTFRDPEAGQENLATLTANPEIVAACLYDANGQMFASYLAPGAQQSSLPQMPEPYGHQFEGRRLVVFRPVILDQDRIGTIYLRRDLRHEYAVARGYALIALLVMAVSLLAAALLSSVLQNSISRPILELAHVAQQIKETKDYSLRATKLGEDELGELIERFNEMLSEIQAGKGALLAVNDALRSEVTERELAETELRALNETLEERVAERSATLAQRAQELALSNKTLVQEIAERRRAEESLKRSEAQLQEAQEIAHIGNWEWNIPANNVTWSDELYRIYGLAKTEFRNSYKEFLERVHSEDRERVNRTIQAAYRDRASFTFEHRIIREAGEIRTLHCTGRIKVDETGQLIIMVGTGQDITERKRAEEVLARRTEELARSNAELERFGYVASHDLQEPLRMVHSYVELLAQRYRGNLDQEADKYINYAIEGTIRMRQLITDLLAYSRAGAPDKPLEPTPVAEVVNEAMDNLRTAIEGTGAVVTTDKLPVVLADRTQLVQVFQNLIANAIKFVGTRTPQIHIGATREDGHWCFSLSDNGIGIDPAYFSRIFGVFQRLHGRQEYAGNGIGLAICKKVVERHGGKIWVESKPGQGTTFRFTLAASPATVPESQATWIQAGSGSLHPERAET